MIITVAFYTRIFRYQIHTVRTSSQRYLAQSRQVLHSKEIIHSPLRLIRFIHVSGPHTVYKLLRFYINKLNLIRVVKNRIRNPFMHKYAGNRRDGIIETLDMLDVNGSIYVNSRLQKLFDILIPLRMAAFRRVCMGQLINKYKLRLPLQGGVKVKFRQCNPLVLGNKIRNALKPVYKRGRLRSGMGLNIASNDVDSPLLGRVRRLQHGICLADAGCVAEKYF